MPKTAPVMSAAQFKALKHPGNTPHSVFRPVGGVAGLGVQLSPSGSRSWLLRITVNGKRREFGLGSCNDLSLAEARTVAEQMRRDVRMGLDPTAKAQRVPTFAEALDTYHSTKLDELGTDKYRAQWRSPIDTYAVPKLGKMPVDTITMQHVLQVVEPIWRRIPVTADRVRGRIERILDWCTVKGYREGDNPARWKGNLKELLPAPSKIRTKRHMPAVTVTDAPAWYALVGQREGMGNRALQFLALTAARSGEVRGMRWDEVHGDVWRVPAERMKMNRDHEVPLSTHALVLLDALPRVKGNPLVFPAPRGGMLSDMTLSAAMKRIKGFMDKDRQAVPHGLRSTFRDWCGQQGYSRELAELSLAHSFGSTVEQSYARDKYTEQRRPLMQAWGDYLLSVAKGSTV